jgi:hypothetical protein
MVRHEDERKRYLQWAADYFDAAKSLLESGQQSKQVVGHLIWTGTELSLKALAVGHGIPTSDKPHDLDNVTKHLVANGVVTNNEYTGCLKPLYVQITGSARDYSEARYPGSNLGYWDGVTEEQLKQALNAGSSGVHDFVKKKLLISLP